MPHKVFENGDVYDGDLVNGIRHGKGKTVMKNGNSYEGAYENDKRNGVGLYTFSNGK
jgi:hypothetical protein